MILAKQKKVLFLTAQLCVGGSEKKAIMLVNCLKKDGYRSALSFFKGDDTLARTIDDDVITFSAKQQGKLDIRAMLKYRKFVLSQRFQCVVSMGLYAAILHKTCLIGASKRPREIISLNMSVPTPKVKRRLPLYKALIGKAHVIYGATYQQQVWEKEYGFSPKTSEVIYNGVNSDHFFPGSYNIVPQVKHHIDKHDIVLGIVAALRPEKAVENLIFAAAILRKQGLPIKVLIVGDGPQYSRLEQTSRQQEMKEHVFLIGALADVRPALSAMDIFVLTSVAVETFSNAALEAMAMGIPVLLSDIGGAREMVSVGQNGFLFPAGNIDEMVKIIRKMIETKSLATMGKTARNMAKERFALKNMVTAYKQTIDRL